MALSTEEKLEILERDGVTAVYTDEDGNTVIQHDGRDDDQTVMATHSEADKVESVPGGMSALTTRKEKTRPFGVGYSISAQDVTAGTSGVLVTKDGDGPFIDTNIHVAGGPEVVNGEPQDQPGEYDQDQNGNYKFGTLEFYVQPKGKEPELCELIEELFDIDIDCPTTPTRGRHDAALVRSYDPDEVQRNILGINNYPERIEAGDIGATYVKSGRTTGVTKLSKKSEDWTGRVREPWGPVTFVDQHLFRGVGGPGSKGGDSGSTILTEDGKAVDSRLFAGNSKANLTIANPYPHFQEEYNVELWKGE